MSPGPRAAAPSRDEVPVRRADPVSSLLAQLGAGLVDDGYERAAQARRAARAGGSPSPASSDVPEAPPPVGDGPLGREVEGPEVQSRSVQGGDSAPGGAPRPVVRMSWSLGLALVVVGLLLATAAGEVRMRAPATAQARAALVAEIRARTSAADALQAQVSGLQLDIARARRALVSARSGRGAADELVRLEVATGAVPVQGPGVRVTVEDASTTTSGLPSRVGGDPAQGGRVLDRDLQMVVNGLLQSGADAVAVNGQRLTTLSAIRSAGSAILVDYRPLSPPYRVEAVGAGQALATAFVDGPAGRYLAGLQEGYGVRFQVVAVRALDLPASAGLSLYHARADVEGTRSPATSAPAPAPVPSRPTRAPGGAR